jgi:hypothetical protein
MDSLSPKGRAIIEASRRAVRPSASDRERVEAALRARLGPEALPAAASPVPSAQPAIWGSAAKGLAALCLVGAAAFPLWKPSSAPPADRRPASTPEAPAATSAAPEDASEKAMHSPEPQPASQPAARASRRRPDDALTQEVALLARATSALRARRPGDALKALDAHRRRFPKGSLTEERHAARAQALCALGRDAEASVELAELPPHSPTAASARQVCERSAQRGGGE